MTGLAQGLTVLAAAGAPFDPPGWTTIPFVLMLLAIAILPLAVPRFWHAHRNKALLGAVLSAPVLHDLLVGPAANAGGPEALGHVLLEYVAFMVLLGSLYTVAGGILVEGEVAATPVENALLLGSGAVLANLIGTTGASMLLIRPLLRFNARRQRAGHVPLFFIFLVSNLGGLLTPLGDPPLFLGYLRGVEFFWTLRLWPQWLVANGIVLTIFFIWDWLAYRGEGGPALAVEASQPVQLRGTINFLFLGAIVAAVLLKPQLPPGGSEVLMLAMALLSLARTPAGVRPANGFTWGPIVEVAVLFAAIFVTMIPALELLKVHGPDFGIREPWQFFWLTGLLSSFLDNAPTYLTFATLAAGSSDLSKLATDAPQLLAAISCGAVFMGSMTYIGNGPNFMVKAIADEAGYRMPSFFGYMLYSCLILLPVFAVITAVFFPPG